MKLYKAVIFDLDGVLCHTDNYHYKAWKYAADKMGVYFDRQINNRLRGVSRMESLEIILEKYKGNLTERQKIKIAEDKNNYYIELLKTMSGKDIENEVTEVLEYIKNKGYLTAVGSSSKNANLILDITGLKKFFNAVSDGCGIKNSKPHPEVFLRAAKLLDLPPKCCLVVEDAASGIDAAVAGGFDSAGLGEAAKHNKTMYKIENITGLKEFL